MSRPEDHAITFGDPPDEEYERDEFPLLRWWGGLDATEQTLYGGLSALGAGLAAIFWPLALIVPGAILVAVALFTFGVVTLRAR